MPKYGDLDVVGLRRRAQPDQPQQPSSHQEGERAKHRGILPHQHHARSQPQPSGLTLHRAARRRGPKRKGIDEAIGYLTNKAGHLRYDTALATGWPIATGVIDGACRHLVKDRLDITGARWGLSGAEAVLKLRALRSNGDFDAYWTWHKQQEFRRNHQGRYRGTLILAA